MKTASTALDQPSPRVHLGWAGLGGFGLVYIFLFALNLILPLGDGLIFNYNSYAMRLWTWSEWSLAGAALAVIAFKWRNLSLKPVGAALVLSLASASGIFIRYQSLVDTTQKAAIVFLTFLGGAALFAEIKELRVRAVEGKPVIVVRAVLFGMLVAIPLSAVNNLYFYLSSQTLHFRNIFYSAGMALSPGVSEEVVYRYFVMALVVWLLRGAASQRATVILALVLSVVPHSLNHLPDLFLQNPVMGIVMLAATSLLFGLPMAWLQMKQSLETAVGFHWLVDFVRFWFGF